MIHCTKMLSNPKPGEAKPAHGVNTPKYLRDKKVAMIIHFFFWQIAGMVDIEQIPAKENHAESRGKQKWKRVHLN